MTDHEVQRAPIVRMQSSGSAASDVRLRGVFAHCLVGGKAPPVFADRFDEDVIMYDARLDSDYAGGVLARGVLWLGAAEGLAVEDRPDASRYADRVGGPALLGDAHGPRLLEILDAACG